MNRDHCTCLGRMGGRSTGIKPFLPHKRPRLGRTDHRSDVGAKYAKKVTPARGAGCILFFKTLKPFHHELQLYRLHRLHHKFRCPIRKAHRTYFPCLILSRLYRKNLRIILKPNSKKNSSNIQLIKIWIRKYQSKRRK